MKCHLCPNENDPVHWLAVRDGYFPLCDGCSPETNDVDIIRVSDLCRAAGAPLTGVRPIFGHNDPRNETPAKPGVVP